MNREGPFHGTHHLALLRTFAHSSASGILEVKARPRTALITFLQGHITWVETNDPNTSAGQVLTDAGMLTAEQLGTRSRCSRRRQPDGANRRSPRTHPTRPRALAHRRRARRLAAGVGWGTGTWRFVETDGATMQGIDERMLPQIDLVRVGWEAVLAWVDDSRARREVPDPTAGPMLPGPDLDYALEQLRLPPSLAPLRERIHPAHAEPAASWPSSDHAVPSWYGFSGFRNLAAGPSDATGRTPCSERPPLRPLHRPLPHHHHARQQRPRAGACALGASS